MCVPIALGAATVVAPLTVVRDLECADFVAEDGVTAEILDELSPGGRFVANADDPRVMRLAAERELGFTHSHNDDVEVLDEGLIFAVRERDVLEDDVAAGRATIAGRFRLDGQLVGVEQLEHPLVF